METAGFSGTFEPTHESTRRQNPEEKHRRYTDLDFNRLINMEL
jgi:hypothetical protein